MKKGLEQFNIVPLCIPMDANGAGALLTSIYFSFKGYRSATIVGLFGDASAGHDLGIKLYQAKDVAGTDAKVLNALSTGRIYSKEAGTFALLQAVTGWTKQTQATADEAWVGLTSGESVGLHAIEISQEDLDRDNGFNAVRADLDDPTESKIIALFAILHDPRYAGAPEDMPNPLVD